MNMFEFDEACRRKAKQIKSDYPTLGLNQRRDIAAKAMGFKHYRSLQKIHKALGDEGVPSSAALVRVGIQCSETPFKQLSASFQVGWSSAKSLTSS